jgi:hypothetical protein
MAKNAIVTTYDDYAYPTNAVFTTPVTLTSSLTAQAIKTGPGRLLKISVITVLAGSGGVLEFWDNVSAGSGTPLYALPVSNTSANVVGSIITVDLPALNGIYLTNASGTITSGAVTIGYS